MGSFKKGDRVTTTETSCLCNEEAAIPTDIPLFFYDYETDGTVWLDDGDAANDDCWNVPLASVTLIASETTHASLERVFALAVAQSRDGKGADRHGNGKPFEEQPIVRDIAELGSNHGAIAQVRKKALESTRLAATGRKDMAMAELLGAMVYAGAAYLILEAKNGETV